jgi:hypothetical protein
LAKKFQKENLKFKNEAILGIFNCHNSKKRKKKKRKISRFLYMIQSSWPKILKIEFLKTFMYVLIWLHLPHD